MVSGRVEVSVLCCSCTWEPQCFFGVWGLHIGVGSLEYGVWNNIEFGVCRIMY